MGVLPLEFMPGENVESLGLKGDEIYSTHGLSDAVSPSMELELEAIKPDGASVRFKTRVRIDTPIEVEYYRNGGILHTVLRRMAQAE